MSVTFKKAGYWGYVDNSPRHFEFASPYDNNFHRPDPNNPVIFRLWKPVNPENLHARHTILPIPNKGKEVRYDLLHDKFQIEGPFRIECYISTNVIIDKLHIAGRKYDWSISLTLDKGGFCQTAEPMPYLAPESGYTNIVIEYNHDAVDWGKTLHGMFYIKYGDPPNYGLISLDYVAVSAPWIKTSDLRMTYWINTNGNRNLDKNPAQEPVISRHGK
jgi:hypothetical protein